MHALFLFHESLNDFLPSSKRNDWIRHTFQGIQSIKDAIEAIGIPHPEVDIILVNDQSVNFDYQLKDDDRIVVYPFMRDAPFPDNYSLSKQYLIADRFVLDVHLGKLGKAMRLLGIDSILENNYTDRMIAQIAEAENRAVLTRDIGLLKHKAIKCGYWLRSQQWEEQLDEVLNRFDLQGKFKPFSRCIVCNGTIKTVQKENVIDQLPPVSREVFQEFYQCGNCKRVYWKGSHFERMEKWVSKVNNFLNAIKAF